MKLTDASLTSFHPSQLRISTPMKHTNTAPIDPIASKGFIHRIRTMTPFNILCYLTIVNLLNYFDRGAIAGVLTSIEREFDLSNTSDGLLAGAFMVGFMITNPIFAHLSYKYQPTNLMFIGLLVWSIATVASVWASSFHMLAFCRMVTGIGEASFAGLAPTYIDDHAPIESRTKWLSLFYSAIPLGGALGYIASGFISEYWKWRGVFYIEGFMMLPLALLCLWLPKSPSVGSIKSMLCLETSTRDVDVFPVPNAREVTEVDVSVSTSLWVLLRSPIYVSIVLGYASYTFVIGAFAFWCPAYLEERFHLSKSEANTAFGAVTAVAGLFGTSFGGWFLDYLMSRLPTDGDDASRIGLKVSSTHVCLMGFHGLSLSFSNPKVSDVATPLKLHHHVIQLHYSLISIIIFIQSSNII
eukprot:TRINITY_DN1326_c0_g1_i3.p1 TRINITY_DN1326_c0_g1~~TRINITY_DN1326_c0_g1_i3.p1  ORF type:complete len:412 (+),score=61.04 TRINITY_DN1326_c0_g1_i3:68-1303(+)